MKKSIFKVFILIAMVIICFNYCINTHAFYDNHSSKISYESGSGIPGGGGYAVTEPVFDNIKVYVTDDMVDFVKSTGRVVHREKDKHYYYANKQVEKIVEVKQISNDIDSMIFMVSELEKKAKAFDETDYKNLVLGYIRTINSEYHGGYLGYWPVIAGNSPEAFIKNVNSDYSHGLRFNEYFGSFVLYDDYNAQVHGELEEKYRRNSVNKLSLVDSVNKNQNIDLIHMFAAIDGIYLDTKNHYSCGNNNQRDIASWNGDLQQAADVLKDKYGDNFVINDYKFEKVLKNDELRCSEADILADIDAMNIAKTYIDSKENSISNSLSAYYNYIKEKESNRFKMFIYSCTIDLETDLEDESKFEIFELEVYTQFNLKKQDDGSIIDYPYYAPIYIGHSIMQNSTLLSAKPMPSKEIREYLTKSFVEYIRGKLE